MVQNVIPQKSVCVCVCVFVEEGSWGSNKRENCKVHSPKKA